MIVDMQKFQNAWPAVSILFICIVLQAQPSLSGKALECRPKGDLAIGIDSSFSINNPNNGKKMPHNFDNVRKFVADIIEHLNESNFRTGVFGWSNTTDLVYPLHTTITKKKKLELVKKMRYQAKNTMTDVAIKYGINLLKDKKLKPRPGVPKLLLIMTDGDPFPPLNRDISEAIEEIKQNRIMPIAIGIGLEFKREGLVKIALGREDDVITSDSFNITALNAVLAKLRNITCVIPQQPEPDQVISEETPKSTRLYYCYLTKNIEGVYVNIELLKGGARSYYSFTTRTPHILDKDGDVTIDQGKVWYNETTSFKGRYAEDEEMCVTVITDHQPTEFKISFSPGRKISGRSIDKQKNDTDTISVEEVSSSNFSESAQESSSSSKDESITVDMNDPDLKDVEKQLGDEITEPPDDMESETQPPPIDGEQQTDAETLPDPENNEMLPDLEIVAPTGEISQNTDDLMPDGDISLINKEPEVAIPEKTVENIGAPAAETPISNPLVFNPNSLNTLPELWDYA